MTSLARLVSSALLKAYRKENAVGTDPVGPAKDPGAAKEDETKKRGRIAKSFYSRPSASRTLLGT